MRRKQVLSEQPICAGVFGEECLQLTEDIDHIVSPEDGGAFYDRANLQGLCKKCHGRKTNAEVRTRSF